MAPRIAVAADHAGYRLKERVAAHLKSRGFDVVDVGTHDEERCDYPDFGAAIGHAVTDAATADAGVAVCGSGIGIAMAANKVPGVRAAVVHDETTARLTKQHNDANVICLGSRTTGEDTAIAAIDAWLDATFEGGRHQARVDKLAALDGR